MFAKKDVEDLFNKSVDEKIKYVKDLYYNHSERHGYIENKYTHPLYPLITIENNEEQLSKGTAVKPMTFFRCSLHTDWKNSNFDMLIDHILLTRIDQHKEFIMNEMFSKLDESTESKPKPESGSKSSTIKTDNTKRTFISVSHIPTRYTKKPGSITGKT